MSGSRLPRFDASSETEGKRQPLTRADVVEAALSLLDEVGLDGFTMRRIGDRLGVKSSSLYWHVRNKEELLNLMADAICGEIQAPSGESGWREYLEAMGWEYRRVLHAHRDAAMLLATTLPVGPNRLRFAEMGLAALFEAGFSPDVTARAGLMFADYVTNFVIEEERAGVIAAAFQSDSGGDDGDAIREWFSNLPADEYPSMVALSKHLTDPDADARFQFGVTILLDGLPDPDRT